MKTTQAIWSKTLGIAYYPTPKCGSTSIKLAILDSLSVHYPPRAATVHDALPVPDNVRAWNLSDLRVEDFYIQRRSPLKEFTGFHFSVLRDPAECLLSAYRSKVRDGAAGIPYVPTDTSWDAFLAVVFEDPLRNTHYTPKYLLFPETQVTLLQFERLTCAWKIVQDSSNLKKDLTINNRTERMESDPTFTATQLKKCKELYAEDYKLHARLQESAAGFIHL